MDIRKQHDVCVIDFDLAEGSPGLLLTSDWHLDSPHCDRKLLSKHLNEAKEKNYAIIANGDIFDAMQAKNDPRSSKRELKNDIIANTYFNGLLSDAEDFCKPYASHIALMGYGNHEVSVIKHHEIDLMQMLVNNLNKEEDSHIVLGGYDGFVVCRFLYKGVVDRKVILYYHHGAGGSAPMSLGILQMSRTQMHIPDADIIITGHNHNSFVVSKMKLCVSTRGRVQSRRVYLVKTPTYKEEVMSDELSFLRMKGSPPRPIGGYWVDFKRSHKYADNSTEILISIYEAI